MSLLLDALKEAEKRTRPEPAAASPAPAGRAGGASSAGAEPSLTALLPQLTLADEVAAEAPAPAPRRKPAAYVPVPAPAGEQVAATAAHTPAARGLGARPWLRYTLLLALPLLAALYWVLFRGTAEPLPAPVPPLGNSLATTIGPEAVTAAAATTSTTPAAAPPVALDEGGNEPARGTAPATDSAAAEPAAASVAAPAVSTPQASPVIVQRSSSPLSAAHAALRAGDLQQAEALYRQMLVAEPDQPDARLGLGLIEHSRGAVAAALAHLRAVLQQRPEDPQAWAAMADIVADTELPPMESRLRYLVANRPDPALHFALGNVLARQQRWPEAQESYFAATSGAPSNADYAFNLAVALDRLGKGQAALPHYTRALSLSSDGRAVQFDTGAVRARMAQLAEAAP